MWRQSALMACSCNNPSAKANSMPQLCGWGPTARTILAKARPVFLGTFSSHIGAQGYKYAKHPKVVEVGLTLSHTPLFVEMVWCWRVWEFACEQVARFQSRPFAGSIFEISCALAPFSVRWQTLRHLVLLLNYASSKVSSAWGAALSA